MDHYFLAWMVIYAYVWKAVAHQEFGCFLPPAPSFIEVWLTNKSVYGWLLDNTGLNWTQVHLYVDFFQ